MARLVKYIVGTHRIWGGAYMHAYRGLNLLSMRTRSHHVCACSTYVEINSAVRCNPSDHNVRVGHASVGGETQTEPPRVLDNDVEGDGVLGVVKYPVQPIDRIACHLVCSQNCRERICWWHVGNSLPICVAVWIIWKRQRRPWPKHQR